MGIKRVVFDKEDTRNYPDLSLKDYRLEIYRDEDDRNIVLKNFNFSNDVTSVNIELNNRGFIGVGVAENTNTEGNGMTVKSLSEIESAIIKMHEDEDLPVPENISFIISSIENCPIKEIPNMFTMIRYFSKYKSYEFFFNDIDSLFAKVTNGGKTVELSYNRKELKMAFSNMQGTMIEGFLKSSKLSEEKYRTILSFIMNGENIKCV